MEAIEALILGLTQGLSEWLPISSSGHLVILQEFMGLQVPVLFDVLLHVATALVVLVFMRKEVVEIIKSLARFMGRWRRGDKAAVILKEEKGATTAWLIALGTVPTALVGFALWRWKEPLFRSLTTVGIAMLVTGVVLMLTYFVRNGSKRPLSASSALAIGIVQGIAITPGISRSGTTISAGMFLSADRVEVARYSFLLAVPAILGAAVAGALEIAPSDSPIDLLGLSIALIAAAISAFVALKILLHIITRARLFTFAPYCMFVGIAILIWSMF